MPSKAARGFLAAGLFSVSLAAEPEPESSAAPRPTGYYETATVWGRPLDDATASVTVLDREQIEAIGVLTVAELIRHVPGLNVAGGGAYSSPATAQIRGGEPNYTYVLLDGVPLNDPTDQLGGIVNLNSLSTVHVERIEVVRGPLSSFYGPTGVGGVINIITRRGQTEKPSVTVRGAGGSDSQAQIAAALSRRTDGGDYFVGVDWEQADGQIGDDAFEEFAVQGNVELPTGRASQLRLAGRVAAWEAEDYPEASGGPAFGTGDLRDSEHEELSLSGDWRIGSSRRRHKVLATLYRHDLERTSPFVPPDPSNPFRFVPESVEDTEYVNAQLAWVYPAVAKERAEVNVGAEVEWERAESDTLFLFPSPFPPGDGSYSERRTTAGVFAEAAVERGRALIEMGLRVDFPEGFDTELSPRVGMSYRFEGTATRLHGSVGRSFKLPSFFATSISPVIGGNPDLVPEVGVQLDVGAEQRFDSVNLTTDLTLFHYEFDDRITFVAETFRHENLPETESTGAELGVNWTPALPIVLRANVTWQDLDTGDSEPLRQQPDWVAGLRFSWNALERLRWSVDGQWVSDSFDFQIPVPERDHTSGFPLYGTAVTWGVTPRWKLDARFDNLTDEDYETFIGFPGPGRSFRVGATFTSR